MIGIIDDQKFHASLIFTFGFRSIRPHFHGRSKHVSLNWPFYLKCLIEIVHANVKQIQRFDIKAFATTLILEPC